LTPMVRSKTNEIIQSEYPMWVEIEIAY
jgi:hypothetical protein